MAPPLLGREVSPGRDGLERALHAPGRLEYLLVCDRKTPGDRKLDLDPQASPGQDIFRSDTPCMQLRIVGASNLQMVSDIEPEAYC
eukprot:9207067-Pyramimonas_sp.AAC.1